MLSRLLIVAFLCTAGLAQAGTPRYEASTLKYLYTITLDWGNAKGTFTRSEYGVNKTKYDFRGKWVPLPDGGKGRGLRISFSQGDLKKKGDPYPFADGQKSPTWRLVMSGRDSRIYVPMMMRVYSKPPRWKTAELTFDRS